MKDSGIEWLGEIPSEWKLTKNRYYLEHKPNKFNESDNTNVLSLTTKGVKIKENLYFGKTAESYIGHQLVEKDDIVFTPRDFDQTPILSDVSQFNGCISNLYIVDRTKKTLFNHFLNYYWYGLKYSVNYFKNFSHGMRYSFNRSQFDEIPLLLPSLEEQKKIVNYLDDKTQQIDLLIEKIKNKTELLEEQRSALINQVITKGLDPNVEMKDSGIDWIGEIPKHWSISALKYISNITYGISPPEESYNDAQLGSILINGPVEFSKDYLGFSQSKKWTTDPKKFAKKKSILFCLRASTGRINIAHENISIGRGVCGIESNTNNKFLSYSLLSLSLDLTKRLSGSIFSSVTKKDVDNFKLPNPIIHEQKKIVDYLDKKTEQIDSLIENNEKKIELLAEQRSALISNLVTGKIRVS